MGLFSFPLIQTGRGLMVPFSILCLPRSNLRKSPVADNVDLPYLAKVWKLSLEDSFFILLSTCRWLAGSLVPTWLKSANVLASSLSGQWAYSSIAYDKFCVYISSSRAYYRESIDADIKREKEKQKAVSLSFIHFIDATLIDATLMTMLTLIMTCTASHISLASICVSQVHQSTSKCTSYYRKNWRLKNQPQSSPLLSGPPRPQG